MDLYRICYHDLKMSAENELERIRRVAEEFLSKYIYPYIYDKYLELNRGRLMGDEDFLDQENQELLQELKDLRVEFSKTNSEPAPSWGYIWIRAATRLNVIYTLMNSNIERLEDLDRQQTKTSSIFDLANRMHILKEHYFENPGYFRINRKFIANGGLMFLNIERLTWRLALEDPGFREEIGINYN